MKDDKNLKLKEELKDAELEKAAGGIELPENLPTEVPEIAGIGLPGDDKPRIKAPVASGGIHVWNGN